MANNHHDPEHAASLLIQWENYSPATYRRKPVKIFPIIFLSTLLLSSVILLIFNSHTTTKKSPSPMTDLKPPSSRILPKKYIPHLFTIKAEAFLRAENNVSWQRTAFHFQPASHYICDYDTRNGTEDLDFLDLGTSDPDGPLYHMGWYHLFYQYNPVSAVWGNITWAHAVSKDMINWFHLPLAMVPEHWYDIKGVLSGSATVLPSGEIVMLYTGNAYDLTQVQCLAYAANSSDPLLLDWVKYEKNPILIPPPGIGLKDFRDPTTAWVGPDGKYVIAIGSKHNTTGITLLYKTTDFKNYELLDWELHGVFATGMWECVDLYPVSTTGLNGLDMSANGPGIKHVLKESGDEDRHDWYAIGTYDQEKIVWTPDDLTMDVGIGLRYDYGKFYASRSFYDQHKQRRILWGYLGETDTPTADLFKGWAQVLNIPRTVVFDAKTKSNLIQWPIEEVNNLRSNSSHDFEGLELQPGSLIPLKIGSATQLDIEATFEIDEKALEATVEADVGFNCTTSDGSKGRAVLGPFGLVVIADKLLTELTPVYFYIVKGTDGSDTTYFCADETRSSLSPNVRKMVVGSKVPVLRGENLTMRLLVDHSVVESFAQGGRTVITSRVYPTKAIYDSAKLFLFNNATGITVKASLKIWHMSPAKLDPYPFDK